MESSQANCSREVIINVRTFLPLRDDQLEEIELFFLPDYIYVDFRVKDITNNYI
jgi:hypothetical protein